MLRPAEHKGTVKYGMSVFRRGYSWAFSDLAWVLEAYPLT